MACSFLAGLYNSGLGLVRTTPSSNDYYSTDNIFAAAALNSSQCSSFASTDRALNKTVTWCCIGYSIFQKSLLGVRLQGTPPFQAQETVVYANSSQNKLFNNVTTATAGGNYTVFLEVVKGGTIPDCVYADVTVYSLLEFKLAGNTTGVDHELACLSLMFDGKGLVDEPYKDGTASEHGVYQTYKLALYLYAQQKTGSYYFGLQDSLLRLQGPDGGFHTGYDQAGTYDGTLENAKTTSIAIIALSGLSQNNPFISFFPNIPLWIIGVYAAAVSASVGTVILLLYRDKRKLRRMPPVPKQLTSSSTM